MVDNHVPALGWPHVWLGDIMTAWTEMMNSEVGKLRDMIAAAVGETEVTTHSRVELGRPSHALLSLSADVDLLVIGSRRWGRLTRLVLGGTGEALLSGAAGCPVLVVPRPHDQTSAR